VSLGLPLNSEIQEKALSDSEGDLIDALVMLLAARDALSSDHKTLYDELNQRGLLGVVSGSRDREHSMTEAFSIQQSFPRLPHRRSQLAGRPAAVIAAPRRWFNS
jgi:hypothetical protein